MDVIAHELAHSWSGNLVTNCSWEHFWLNEGWTVYLERRVSRHIPHVFSGMGISNSFFFLADANLSSQRSWLPCMFESVAAPSLLKLVTNQRDDSHQQPR